MLADFSTLQHVGNHYKAHYSNEDRVLFMYTGDVDVECSIEPGSALWPAGHQGPADMQFTDEERAAPELEKYIKKSDKAADRLDKAKAAIKPK